MKKKITFMKVGHAVPLIKRAQAEGYFQGDPRFKVKNGEVWFAWDKN